jgi:VCBS repeat-containing protein
MRAAGAIGRVGGLAIALGIGAAVATGSIGVAAAAPADDTASSTDSSSSDSAGSSGASAPSPRTSRASDRARPARSSADALRRAGNDNPSPAAVNRPVRPAPSAPESSVPAKSEAVTAIQAPAVADRVPSKAVSGRTSAVTAAASPAPVWQAPPALRGATAPRVAATAAVGTVQSVLVPFSSSGPGSPAESAMSWTVLAAVRRLGRPDPAPTPAATVSTGQVFTPRAAARTSFSWKWRNKTPTVAPTQSAQSPTGVIVGNINATDRDGDPLTFTVAANPARGTLQVDPTGAFVYTPDKAAAHDGLTDQFAITVSDEAAGTHRHGFFSKGGHSVTSTITVTVTPVNSAPIATVSTGVPDAGTGVVTGQVSATDDDGDPISYTGPTTTDKGALMVGSDGAFTYTPTAAARHAAAKLTATAADKTDTFTLTVNDDHGGSTAVPVTVAISPVNSAPTSTTSIGAPNTQTGLVTGLVAGADADGDPLTYAGSTTTAKGAFVVGEDGVFTYTPTAAARHAAAKLTATQADKSDTFTVTITDGYGGTKSVPVTVTVSPFNTAPVASATAGAPNASTGVVLGTITASDADGDSLTFTGATTSKGAAVVSPGGQITYTPTAAARHAAASPTATAADRADTFTATVTDGHGGSTAVAVAVTISPANSAPTGTVNVGSPNPDTAVVTGSVIGADSDGDRLTYTAPASTAKGSIVLAANGGFTYTPTSAARRAAASPTATAADKADTFTVTITDGYGGSTAVPVTVAILPANVAPVITSAAVGTPNPSTGVATGSVAATDADGDALSYSGSTTAKGTAVVSANGAITYTPTAAARHAAAKLTAPQSDKVDTFTVTVSDGRGGSASAPVAVAIAPANVAPTGTTTVGAPDAATGVLAGAVLGADLDGDALTYSGPGATAKGTVVLSPNGTFTYTPSALARHVAGLTGATQADTTDTFVVTVVDGYGGTAQIPVTVSVSPANVSFTFVYGGSGWTPEAQSAMQTAANRLSSYLVVNRPVTITYTATGQNQPNENFLASNYTTFTSSSPGFYGTVVQTEILTGVDTNGSAADSQISWNFAYPWALGNAVPNNRYDFQSVAMHEMMHSLGILSGVGSPTSLGNNWTVYDSMLSTANGTDVIGANYVWDPAYVANLTGGNGGLYFEGPNAVAAYGGPVPIYTPGTWAPGSSVVHLDPARAPAGTTYLMDPSDGYGLGVRALTPVEIGMLRDLGYTVYQSGGIAFIFVGLRLRRRRRFDGVVTG